MLAGVGGVARLSVTISASGGRGCSEIVPGLVIIHRSPGCYVLV